MKINGVERYNAKELPSEQNVELETLFREIANLTASFKSERAGVVKKQFLSAFNSLSWSTNTVSFPDSPFRISASTRHGLSLQIQFGNLANAFYDLLKLQYLYESILTPGVLIVPTLRESKNIASNVANFEAVHRNMQLGFNKFISLPLVIVGIEE